MTREMNLMIGYIIEKAEEHLNIACIYADSIKNKDDKTNILNAEYCLGKSTAYMEMLETLDFSQFVEFADKCNDKRETIIKAIEKLYN